MATLAPVPVASGQVEIFSGPSTRSAPPAPKSLQQRTIQRFDFEEPENPYPVPRYWSRVVDTPATPRPGFPRFNEASFDFAVAHLGRASVRLPTRGGSTAIRLQAGTIPVFPRADYAVTAFVRTQGVSASRAFLTARFLDQNQRLVPGGQARSAPILSEGDWTQVTLELMGLSDDVAFLQLELELLQPRQQPADARDAARATTTPAGLDAEDLDASAWFDTISISQIPRVEVSTTAAGNLFTSAQTPTVSMTIRDLVGERLIASLRVSSLEGELVDSATLPIDASGRPMQWTPRLVDPGWYDVQLDVSSDERILTRARTMLVWLAPPRHDTGAGDLARFGMHADRATVAQSMILAPMARTLRLGHITLPVWDAGADSAAVTESIQQLGPVLDALLSQGMSVTLCMPRIPTDLAMKHSLDPEDPLSIALTDQREWLALMNPALDRYGQGITRWLVGRIPPRSSPDGIGADEAFWGRSVPDALSRLHASLSLLVPGPRITLPWRVDLDLSAISESIASAAQPSCVSMVLPAWVDRNSIDEFAQRYQNVPEPRPELTIVPQYPASPAPERSRVAGFTRDVIEAWRQFGETRANDPLARFAVNFPLESLGTRRPHLAPDPELAVWATLADQLAGRRIIGEYPAPEGVRCYILAPMNTASTDDSTSVESPASEPVRSDNHSGALILWNASGDPANSFITVYAPAGRARIVDPMGRVRELAATGDPTIPTDAHRVVASDMPVFIDGVDAKLASLIASFRVVPDFLPAVAIEHELEIRLTNPWETTITGRLQIVSPAGAGPGAKTSKAPREWAIVPDGAVQVQIGPGQTQVFPFAVTLPAAEDAGEKILTALLRLDSEQHAGPIRLTASVSVGLEDVALTAKADVGPTIDGPNVVVSVQVVNRGKPERFLRLQVAVPGMPTREFVLTNPAPGETISKRFVYTDAAARLRGKRVRVSVSDEESASRLNTTISVP